MAELEKEHVITYIHVWSTSSETALEAANIMSDSYNFLVVSVNEDGLGTQ
jgi:hypothetical protein